MHFLSQRFVHKIVSRGVRALSVAQIVTKGFIKKGRILSRVAGASEEGRRSEFPLFLLIFCFSVTQKNSSLVGMEAVLARAKYVMVEQIAVMEEMSFNANLSK